MDGRMELMYLMLYYNVVVLHFFFFLANKTRCSLHIRQLIGSDFSGQEKSKKGSYTLFVRRGEVLVAKYHCEKVYSNSIQFDCTIDCSIEDVLDFQIGKRSSISFSGGKYKTKYIGQAQLSNLLPVGTDTLKTSYIEMTDKDIKTSSSQESLSTHGAQLQVEVAL
jgi:hypothetical protein